MVLVSGLAGCAGLQPDLPTPIPDEMLPTVIAQTAAASRTDTPVPAAQPNEPTETAVPITALEDMPTHAPTVTLEPTGESASVIETPVTVEAEASLEPYPTPLVDPNAEYPEAEIKILRPGDLSRVVSPFRVVANLTPGHRDKVKLELLGEDGRILVSKIIEMFVPPGYTRANFVTEMDFEVRGAAELGRLEISVEDEFGRVRSLSSVDLILLSEGIEELRTPPDQQEDIIIQEPPGNVMLQGDRLYVSGVARTPNEEPLVLELITEEGKIVGSGLATIVQPVPGGYGLFVGEAIYNVSEPTWVRLIVRVRGSRIPGTTHLTSLEVVISP